MALAEVVTNLAASGIKKLQDIKLCANWMAASNEDGQMANLYEGVRTLTEEMCQELGLAIPVGKDSLFMSASWDKQNVYIAPVFDNEWAGTRSKMSGWGLTHYYIPTLIKILAVLKHLMAITRYYIPTLIKTLVPTTHYYIPTLIKIPRPPYGWLAHSMAVIALGVRRWHR